MSGSTDTLWRQFREGEPLCVVLYPNLAARDDVIETVRLVAPQHWTFTQTRDVEDAFLKLKQSLLITPEDEGAAVRTLDGRREALVDREVTAFLFILKGGSGEDALRFAPGLASWLQGREYDPEPSEIDLDREQARFKETTGRSPQEWLTAWRHGEIQDTLENNFRYQRALLLEDA